MKDVKPAQLLVGRERDLENNPDFSNKDSTNYQSLAPAGAVRVPAAAPLQPSELPTDQAASIPCLPLTTKTSQVIFGRVCLRASMSGMIMHCFNALRAGV